MLVDVGYCVSFADVTDFLVSILRGPAEALPGIRFFCLPGCFAIN